MVLREVINSKYGKPYQQRHSTNIAAPFILRTPHRGENENRKKLSGLYRCFQNPYLIFLGQTLEWSATFSLVPWRGLRLAFASSLVDRRSSGCRRRGVQSAFHCLLLAG